MNITQKIIKVGNSYAITLPKAFTNKVGWKAGDDVIVEANVPLKTLSIQQENTTTNQDGGLTPEFRQWLSKFNKKHKGALQELAKK